MDQQRQETGTETMTVSPAHGRADMGMRLKTEWWLRSPGNNNNNAALVNNDGNVNAPGNNVNNNLAIRLDLPRLPEMNAHAGII